MAAGQLAFAFAQSYPTALLARAVVGAGDAMIFISVMRLVAVWFLVKQAPLVTQLTGQLGQLGSVLAAAPLSVALHQLGWTRTFAAISVVGLVVLVAVALAVKDSPYRSERVVQVKLAALARSLQLVWGNPGTRLGLWSHFISQFPVTVFSLLWGYPFLVSGEGLSPTTAGVLLMLTTASALTAGLVLGRPRTAVAAGSARLRDRGRRPDVDGRLRPRPQLPPGGGAGPGQRGRQHRRVRRLAAHDGAGRRGAGPQAAGRRRRLRPRRLPGRAQRAVPLLGARSIPGAPLPPASHRPPRPRAPGRR